MPRRPESLDRKEPVPRTWLRNRALDWIANLSFLAAGGCAVFSHIGAFELAVPFPLLRMPTTYLAPGLAALGVAVCIWREKGRG